MAGRNKEDFLYEFAGTGLANNCRSVEDLERRFYNWMKRSNYRLVSYGKDYFNNEFSYVSNKTFPSVLDLPEYSGSFQGSGYSAGAGKEKVGTSNVYSFFFNLKALLQYTILKTHSTTSKT